MIVLAIVGENTHHEPHFRLIIGRTTGPSPRASGPAAGGAGGAGRLRAGSTGLRNGKVTTARQKVSQ